MQTDFITQLHGWIAQIDAVVWGPYVLIPLLLGTGVYLTFGLRFMPFRMLVPAFKHMLAGRKHGGGEGELTPFNALMTSLAATVGTGNIVGVATAISLGGPGAMFWMWMTALFGMATKFCEATLAVKYREVLPNGSYAGGPMYYIRKGLGEKWKWLAWLFALFGSIACFGIGNLTQANAISSNVVKNFGISRGMFGLSPEATMGLVLFLICFVIIVGGVKRIGEVAGRVVPFMCVFYVILGIYILLVNYKAVPGAFYDIFAYAFAPTPAVGGFVGAVVKDTIQRGVARGLFSNEAGLGSAPIAHATATVKDPVHQGFLGMIDPFLDTIIVCTMTGLVIITGGLWSEGTGAAVLTATSFEAAIPGFGKYAVTVALALFAFTTILGWCVYGERCVMYIFGHKASMPFRVIFCLVVPIGAVFPLNFVWDFSDLANGLMALPNLVALLLLSPIVFKLAREHMEERKRQIESGDKDAI